MAQASIAYRKADKATRFLETIENHWKVDRITEITPEMIRQAARKLYPKGQPGDMEPASDRPHGGDHQLRGCDGLVQPDQGKAVLD